ncbi:MAG: hypothetical protein AAGC46_15280 [Solirubrobacteraceae bacterium]|nr:hypothetical protein [Patulibacter sp.]
MFGRSDPPSSGLPGAAPSALGGLPGSGAVSLGKAEPARTPAEPGESWQLGSLGTLAFLIVALAAATYGFAADRQHRKDDPVDQASRGAITATSALSFTSTERFAAALDHLRAKAPAGARLASLTVAPDDLHGSLVSTDGEDLYVSVDPSLGATVRHTGMGMNGLAGLALNRIPTDAPSRIVRVAGQKLHLAAADLDHLSFSSSAVPGTPGSWSATYTHGFRTTLVQAALDGTDVRLTGQPDADARAQLRDAQRRIAAAKTAAARALRKAQQR